MKTASAVSVVRNPIDAVQYLRGIAAFVVFLFHISSLTVATWGPSAAGIDHVGAAGVDLFFVISGFIMAMILSRPGDFSPREFLVRRIARVFPGYYIATIGVFVLAIMVPTAMASTSADIFKLLRSLAFFPWEDQYGSTAPLLLVGWTLNYEVYFYALVAIIAGMFGDRGLFKTAGVLVSIVVIGWIVAPDHPTVAFYTNSILLEFALGILAWHCHMRLQGNCAETLSFFVFTGGVAFFALQHESDPGIYRVLVWGVPSAMILFGSLRMMRFSNAPLRLLGDWSYSFYLTHLFIITGYIRFIMPVMPDLHLIWGAHYAVMTIICLTVAWVFHELVEKRTNQLLLRLFSRTPPKGAEVPVAASA